MIPSNIEILPDEQYDDTGTPDQLKASDNIAVECVTQDAVWGEITEDGPNYRNLGFSRAVILQIKSQIGLGVLGLVSETCYIRDALFHDTDDHNCIPTQPATFGIVGMIPGIILIIVMAAIITCMSLPFWPPRDKTNPAANRRDELYDWDVQAEPSACLLCGRCRRGLPWPHWQGGYRFRLSGEHIAPKIPAEPWFRAD